MDKPFILILAHFPRRLLTDQQVVRHTFAVSRPKSDRNGHALLERPALSKSCQVKYSRSI